MNAGLYDLIREDSGQVKLLNREAYLREANFQLSKITEIEILLDLKEDERFMYYEWYGGILAARGILCVVNKDNEIVREKTIWMS